MNNDNIITQKLKEALNYKEDETKSNDAKQLNKTECATKEEIQNILKENNSNLSDISLIGVFVACLIANAICN